MGILKIKNFFGFLSDEDFSHLLSESGLTGLSELNRINP